MRGGNVSYREGIHRFRGLAALVALGACLLVAATVHSGATTAPGATSRDELPRPLDHPRLWVESLAPGLEVSLGGRVRQQVWRQAFTHSLERHGERLRHGELLREMYEKSPRPTLVDGDTGHLSAIGRAAHGALFTAHAHGLDPAALGAAAVARASARLAALRVAGGPPRWRDALDPLAPRALEALVDWSRSRGAGTAAEAREAILAMLAGEGDEAPPELRALQERAIHYREGGGRWARAVADAELASIEATLRLAHELRHGNISRQDWRDFKRAGGSRKFIAGRTAHFARGLVRSSPAEAVALVAALAPQHPEYGRLIEARHRYLHLRDVDGGLLAVPPLSGTLEVGQRLGAVAPLRARLVQEGYGPLEPAAPGQQDVVDAPLLEALGDWQQAHQLARQPQAPGRDTWREMAVSVERRLEELERALEGWRHSQYSGEANYVRINVPEFHGELWRSGERALRFRVVVGSNERRCNEKTGRWEHPNRTPVPQTSRLERMILNPYWYVPQRIVEEELRPQMEREEGWLETQGYEIFDRRGGRLVIRQRPGPNNALGRVKFLFPNPHNTYLHDTRRRDLFDAPRRAFSHGCVRVDAPLELARALLEADGQGETLDVEGVVAQGTQKVVDFARPLPVYLEYVTARVDEQGRVHFLRDLYQRHVPQEKGTEACQLGGGPHSSRGARGTTEP